MHIPREDIMDYWWGIWDILMVEFGVKWYKEVTNLMIKHVFHQHLCFMSRLIFYRPPEEFYVININNYSLQY